MSASTDTLANPLADPAARRSFIYQLFASAFEYPDAEFIGQIRSGAVADRFQEVLASVVSSANWDALKDAGKEDDALQIEYTRLFDAGVSGPPCALYGGEYTGARMQTMEELIRFYNFFSLSMSETPHELPDHLVTELEFLHFLTFRESELARIGEDVTDMQRAERDFIARHPGRWVPQMFAKLEKQNPMPFFLELARLLLLFLKHEEESLVAEVGRVPDEVPGEVVKFVN